MKKYLPIIFLLFMASPCHADVHTADSCSLADVSTAITAASSGDTVIVPAGSCTWDTGLTITKGIILQSAGGTTLVNNTGGDLITYKPADFTLNSAFRMTGFTINLNSSGSGLILDGNSADSPLNPQTKIRIDHNTFITDVTDTSTSHQGINNKGMLGVIDNNTFTNIAFPLRSSNFYGTGEAIWNNWTGLTYGGSNNMYYEDNVFTGATNIIDCQYANRYVMRYNTITTVADSYPLMDMHGNQDAAHGDMWACFGGEIYGNNINAVDKSVRLLDHRGGKALVFFNNVNTSANFNQIQVRDEYADSDNPSTNAQPQYPSDSYYWINRKGVTGTNNTINQPTQVDGKPAADSEYHQYTDTFDGTSGMGCGALDSRPATCTMGVGYWATTQSCSDLTGMVGKGATPINGTLYKCTSENTWTAYFTPYQYPHPLRGQTITVGTGAGFSLGVGAGIIPQ